MLANEAATKKGRNVLAAFQLSGTLGMCANFISQGSQVIAGVNPFHMYRGLME